MTFLAALFLFTLGCGWLDARARAVSKEDLPR